MTELQHAYIWARFWPSFTTAFPFERVDALDSEALEGALEEIASQWTKDHPGELEAVESKRRRRDAPRLGHALAIGDARGEAPQPLFGRVCRIAGWTQAGPHVVVAVDYRRSHGPRPWPRQFFYRALDQEAAVYVLQVLGMQTSSEGIWRFGHMRANGIDKVRQFHIEREIDSLDRGSLSQFAALAEQASAFRDHASDQQAHNPGEGRGRAQKKSGRRQQFDPKADAKLVELWESSGMYQPDFEKKHGHKRGEVLKAQDRIKARRRRARRKD